MAKCTQKWSIFMENLLGALICFDGLLQICIGRMGCEEVMSVHMFLGVIFIPTL